MEECEPSIILDIGRQVFFKVLIRYYGSVLDSEIVPYGIKK
jgi:hypothetical protein